MNMDNIMYIPNKSQPIFNFFSKFSSIETVNHIFGYSAPASEMMDTIIELYHNTVITLGYVFYIVLAIIVLTIYYFNSKVNYYTKGFNRRVEYLIDSLFVFVPIIIIYCLSVPAIGYIMSNDLNIQSIDSPFNIEIIGHQWYWTYYINANLGGDIYNYIITFLEKELSFYFNNLKIELEQIMTFDDNPTKRYFEVGKYVILPVGETIRCELTSVDVIHSWAVPQLGIKIDAIPGRVQTFYIRSYITGVVYGQCSEFCGENHGFMPIIIEFVEIETFFDWILKCFEVNPYQNFLFMILLNKTFVFENENYIDKILEFLSTDKVFYIEETLNQDVTHKDGYFIILNKYSGELEKIDNMDIDDIDLDTYYILDSQELYDMDPETYVKYMEEVYGPLYMHIGDEDIFDDDICDDYACELIDEK